MIKGLFETHLHVEDLEQSIQFYSTVLKLKLCYYEEERRAAFFWIGKDKHAMLGLWEKPKEQIELRHFAFEAESQWIIDDSINFFKSNNISFRNFLNDSTQSPMVFAWMPAISIYFDDPDGHSLEFIGILEGKAFPDKGVLSYQAWKDLQAE